MSFDIYYEGDADISVLFTYRNSHNGDYFDYLDAYYERYSSYCSRTIFKRLSKSHVPFISCVEDGSVDHDYSSK